MNLTMNFAFIRCLLVVCEGQGDNQISIISKSISISYPLFLGPFLRFDLIIHAVFEILSMNF